jgi:capsular polysaccharide transport system permease protein
VDTLSTELPQLAAGGIEKSLRAAAISRSLRNAAYAARSPAVGLRGYGGLREHSNRAFVRAVLIAFAAVVVVPILASVFYLAFIMSNQFATTTQFAVRGGRQALLASLSSLAGAPALETMQDSMIVANYIQSQGVVEAIDSKLDLRAIYSRSGVDILSRFDPSEPIEELVTYWKHHVYTYTDSQSGIITVIVRAFAPQDSLNIANALIQSSEQLVNDLSERSRRDALHQAQIELHDAETNLQRKVAATRDLRDTEGMIDAGQTVDVLTKMAGDLRLDLARAQQEYAADLRYVSADSPQMKVMNARIENMHDQIQKIEDQMTNGGELYGSVLADSMSRFDEAKLEEKIAEQQYNTAVNAFERARLDIESQEYYLTTFVTPILAQEAYPLRLLIWAIISVGSLALWGIGVVIAVLVRNHLAT